ncbi:MAG TPA: biotin transporter BioY [Chloroflexota bacterium]|jgi:biotin transport system substrate-specific component
MQQTISRVNVFARSSLLSSVLTTTLFALLVALFARISIPLPFTPVPFTLQPMAVMLTGLILGSRLGFFALLEYFALGAVGAPVWAGGAAGINLAAMSSLGYLISYPFAAWVIGWLSEKSNRSMLRLTFSGIAGLAVIYVFGVAYLAGWLNLVKHVTGGQVIVQAMALGAAPFIVPDIVKAVITAGVVRKMRD